MIPYEIAEQINLEINSNISYRSDLDLYAVPEKWTEAVFEGDCEDYALAKRKLFREKGYAEFCFLACCWTETKEYHAVLIVKTSLGEYVLDNRYAKPMKKKELLYTWDKIEKCGTWYSVS